MQKFIFQSNGQDVEGTLCRPHNMQVLNPGVILIHGFTSSEKNYIPLGERLAENGMVALTINLRGHKDFEEAGDMFRVKDGFEDGLNAYDFLISHEFVDKERIGVCGSSFGGGIAAYVAGHRSVKSLVLRAPATYSDNWMNLTLKELMVNEQDKFNKMQDISNTQPIQCLEQFSGDLLVISSEQDAIIPEKMIQAFFHAPKHPARSKLIQIKGAPHEMNTDSLKEQFRQATVDWFVSTL